MCLHIMTNQSHGPLYHPILYLGCETCEKGPGSLSRTPSLFLVWSTSWSLSPNLCSTVHSIIQLHDKHSVRYQVTELE